MAETNYKISGHCEQRYAERILNKDNANDVNRFIVENKEKIKTDINKMIIHGQKIYQGKQSQKDGKGKVLDVYLQNTWVVLVDSSNNTCVTIFKIDLGCGDEFNLQYILKMMEKINQTKKNLLITKLEVETESKMYREMISENLVQINNYKSFIKNLEALNQSYQGIIDNNIVKVSQADKDVAECVNKLINKREF